MTWLRLHDRDGEPVLLSLTAMRLVLHDKTSGLTKIETDHIGQWILVAETVADIATRLDVLLNPDA